MYIDTNLFTTVTLLTFLNANASHLSKPILKWIDRATDRERELIEQKATLKREQTRLHMVDDFAKFSKLQRRMNSIDEELSESRGELTTNSLMTRLLLQHGLKVSMGVMLFLLVLIYRGRPVFILDSCYDFSPFSSIISYPNEETNAVSVHMWIMCCAAVAQLIR